MEWFSNLPRPLQYCFIFGAFFICTTSVAFISQYYPVHKVKKKKLFVVDSSLEKNHGLEFNIENKPIKAEEDDSDLKTEKYFNFFSTEDEFEYLINKNVSSLKVAVENEDDGFSEQKIVRKIVILGLENSGKSTLLAELSKKGIHYMEYKPTKEFNVRCISFDCCDLSIWEIGGMEDYRIYWRNFCDTTDMIIFVIDSSDRNKFKLAKTFFSEIFENLHNTVMHIVATKVDKNQSASLEELYAALELEQSVWKIHRVAVVTGSVTENIGIEWLQQLCLDNGEK